MRPDKILFIDTETGGVNSSEHSLLTIAFVVWQSFEIIDSIEILINDGKLNVTPEAMAINKIDLIEHQKNAMPADLAIQTLFKFLNDHFSPDEKITLAGHNINFDTNFLMAFLSSNKYNFFERFSYRCIDTATILYFLYLAGKIKHKTISSQDAFDFFGIRVQKRHTALGDVIATAKLFNILLSLVFNMRKSKDPVIKLKSLFDL